MFLDWITVIALIAIGLTLIIVELIFVPGTTLVGILGFVLIIAGIWIGYATLGTGTGHLVLATTVLLGFFVVFYSLRSDAWTRFALKNRIESRVNDELLHKFQVGDRGKAISALRPKGTALFGEQQQEVETNGEFVNTNATVRIVKITHHKIFVEEISS
ncbi:NfeD family protein [Botryobacter ruber]|uniref:NfeD family protein n=1 Tax=Botryobacter ruber TaxID=2171629 RepID=UPI000E09F2C3|nr:NfeD family protein [Botryobacter ruber]